LQQQEPARDERPRSARAPRVVLAIESSGPGGAEQVVLRLAEHLRARSIDAVIATQRPAWLTELAEQAGIPVWIDAQKPGWDPGWMLRLARRLRRERIDLLHAHEFAMGAFGGAAARLAGVRALVTLHGRLWVEGRRLRQRALRGLHLTGTGLVAVSRDLADYMARVARVPRAAVAVVENGIEIPPEPSAAEVAAVRASVRSELGLAPDATLLVAVGNLYPVKDHATLLRTLPGLANAHVAIAGRGDERPRLEALARELGVPDRVHLLGLRDDVRRCLTAADVFVHPSRSEELPLAVLEAMAAGVAIVATRVGGVPDAIVDDETGRLVEPGDVAALRRALADLLAAPDRRGSLGRAARRRVEERFSIDRMVERYQALYRLS
jgi:glycosyltransferase involved in cell wall biosynthesis